MPPRLRRRALAVLIGLLASAGPATATATAGEAYFLLIFGSQSHPKRLDACHTWATVVRATGDGPDVRTYHLETVTISWYPAALEVRVFARDPEPGVNLDLYQTLALTKSGGQNVKVWGPYVVQPMMYQRALAQAARLNTGCFRYRAISGPGDLTFSDCIHAVADLDPALGRDHYPLVRTGFSASRHIARNIMSRSVYEQRCYNNGWLIPRLGLCEYDVEVVSPQETPYLLFGRRPD